MPRKRKWRAVAGMVAGLLLMSVGAAGTYIYWKPGRYNPWAFMLLAGVPLAVWGCASLAKSKGYSSAIAYGSFMVAWITAGVVLPKNFVPAIGFVFLFVTLLPGIVVLVLPDKGNYYR